MALNDLLRQARTRYGQVPTAMLSADQPTGEKPLELFITEEHTEHYLALKAGGDNDRGLITGVLGGGGVMILAATTLIALCFHRWELVPSMLWICAPMLIAPFLWEIRQPLPLPILFNRRTREVYFDHGGLLYHSPWDGIQAIACEFQMVGPHTGGMRNAALEVLLRRLGEPDNTLIVSLGLPMGKSLAMQQAFWEYLRSYMNNGPWFDENGNPSESDTFVRCMLAATQLKKTDWHTHTLASIRQKRTENGGKNYLTGIDALMLIGELLFYPMSWLQEFTYNVAKRHSRNRWPQIVTERLQSDGPTNRLIDLERERGL